MINVPELFGESVFNLQVMQDKLPKEVFKSLKIRWKRVCPLKRGYRSY